MFVILIPLLISQIRAQIIAPNPCGVNAQYSGYCGVGCATCAQPNRGCIILYLYLLRCLCLPGYVLNTAANNTCVPVNSFECRAQRFYSIIEPPNCGPNARFVYCGICDATCADPCICGRCVCADGYLRDRNGNCIERNSFRCIIERPITVSPIDPITATLISI